MHNLVQRNINKIIGSDSTDINLLCSTHGMTLIVKRGTYITPETLSILHNYITERCITKIAVILGQALELSPQWATQCLNLFFQQNKNLNTLEWPCNNLSTLLRVMKNNDPRITNLTLYGMNIRQDTLLSLIEVLPNTHITKITTKGGEWCITNDAMPRFIEVISNLTSLNINVFNLRHENVQAFINALPNTHITELSVSNSDFTSIQALVNVLPNTHISTLSITDNIPNNIIQTFFNILPNTHITKLNIHVPYTTDTCALISALPNKLTGINLHVNDIEDHIVLQGITRTLSRCTHITTLMLLEPIINPQNMQILINTLPNTHISKLCICVTTEEHMQALVNVLPNTHITDLTIDLHIVHMHNNIQALGNVLHRTHITKLRLDCVVIQIDQVDVTHILIDVLPNTYITELNVSERSDEFMTAECCTTQIRTIVEKNKMYIEDLVNTLYEQFNDTNTIPSDPWKYSGILRAYQKHKPVVVDYFKTNWMWTDEEVAEFMRKCDMYIKNNYWSLTGVAKHIDNSDDLPYTINILPTVIEKYLHNDLCAVVLGATVVEHIEAMELN